MQMNYPPDGGRGRGRGRGKNRRPTPEEIAAYLKANRLQYPSLEEAGSSSTPSLKEVILNDEVFRLNKTLENIIVLDSNDDLSDPWEIKAQYLDIHMYPAIDSKSRYVYEAILQETGSVSFHHTFDGKPGRNTPIHYSKAIIKMVIPMQKWAHHSHRSRALSIKDEEGNPLFFNYWDYVEAWTKAFFYQNTKKKHTWFIKLCPNLNNKKEVPDWFYRWWSKLGPQPDCIPENVLAQAEFLIANHPRLNEFQNNFKHSFFFFQEFGIPWIWRWDLQFGKDNLGLAVLQRTFHYKWWKGMDLTTTFALFDAMKDDLKKQIKQQQKASGKNVFIETSALIKNKNPTLTDQEVVIKTMDFFKEQFLQSIQTNPAEDDESMTSAKSGDDPNPFACLAGEGQDPYDDDDQSPSMGDYWDGITEMLRKGKEKE